MKEETTATKKYAVPALEKGLDILEFLSAKAIPLSQTEIAQGINRNANEIYRVLIGLESRGYLIRDELSGKYRVSLKLFSLSRTLSPIDKLRQMSIPIMEDLAARHGHSFHLGMLYQSQLIVIAHAQSHAPVTLTIAEGTLFPIITTTSGKLLLAFSNENVRKLLYERDDTYQTMNKTERAKLEAELVKIRKDGFCIESSKITEGVTNCAAIVGEPNGAIIAALSVSSLSSSIGKLTPKDELTKVIIQSAKKISERVGC